MSSFTLDEDSIDEILYLARANEISELASYLSELCTQTKHSKSEVLAAGVDAHSKNSALHYAAANGNIDVIKLLLTDNADKVTTSTPGLINAVNDAGNTPLHWAALNGHLECVKQLVQLGADVTIINKAGHDAVFEAEINDKKEVVDWLLGTVEELEQGIGQNGTASTTVKAEDDMEVDNEGEGNTTNDASESSVTGVEGVRRQMEGINTTDGPSQGG